MEIPPKRNWNKHHVFWRRKDYTSPREKQFRNLAGLVVPMQVEWHNDLHANIRPPQKPKKDLMHQIIDYGYELDSDTPYERFNEIAVFIGQVAETSPHYGIADNAQRIAANLVLQASFIEVCYHQELSSQNSYAPDQPPYRD